MLLQKFVQNERIVRPIREVNLLLSKLEIVRVLAKLMSTLWGKTLLVFSYKM